MALEDEEVAAPLDFSKVRSSMDEVRNHEVYGINRTWSRMGISWPAGAGEGI